MCLFRIFEKKVLMDHWTMQNEMQSMFPCCVIKKQKARI